MDNQSYKQAQQKDKDTFIKNMITLREANGWTQEQFHAKVGFGLKFKTYQAWEEQRCFPPIFFCRIIAAVCKTDLSRMLTEKISPCTTNTGA